MNMKKIMNWRNGMVLALVALLALGFISCSKNKKEEPRYRLEKVEQGDIAQTVAANGTLNPVTLVSVGTQVSGMVQQLFVDYNDRVEKGQVLMTLDDSLLQAAVQQSQANLEAARSAYTLAQTNLQRLEPLAKEGFVSAQEFDQARQTLRDAQARVTQLKAQLDRDHTNLAYSVIRSPVSGVVVARVVEAGQTVAASFNTPELFKIAADLKEMQIDAYFAEADVGQIRVGQKVGFRVDAYPNERFSGEVKQVRLNPKTESNVVTYNVVVAVANPDEKLLPGMTAYVDVTISEKANVLRVPNTALRFRPAEDKEEKEGGVARNVAAGSMPNMGGPRPRGGGRSGNAVASRSRVYQLKDGEAVEVKIEAGIADRRYTEIKSGLKVGDEVIVEDLSLVQEKRQNKGFMMGM